MLTLTAITGWKCAFYHPQPTVSPSRWQATGMSGYYRDIALQPVSRVGTSNVGNAGKDDTTIMRAQKLSPR